MRILAIETASPPGSIALVNSVTPTAYQSLENQRTTTASFAITIRNLKNGSIAERVVTIP